MGTEVGGRWSAATCGCRHNRSLSCAPSPLMACPCCLVPLVARHVGVRCSQSFRTITLSPLRLDESPFFINSNMPNCGLQNTRKKEFDESIRGHMHKFTNSQVLRETLQGENEGTTHQGNVRKKTSSHHSEVCEDLTRATCRLSSKNRHCK